MERHQQSENVLRLSNFNFLQEPPIGSRRRPMLPAVPLGGTRTRAPHSPGGGPTPFEEERSVVEKIEEYLRYAAECRESGSARFARVLVCSSNNGGYLGAVS